MPVPGVTRIASSTTCDGIFVELLKDVSLRIAPVNEKEALAKTIERVSSMAMALGSRLKELDINALIVFPEGQGVRVADALAVLQDGD